MILYNIKTFAVNTIGDVISPSKKINIGFNNTIYNTFW